MKNQLCILLMLSLFLNGCNSLKSNVYNEKLELKQIKQKFNLTRKELKSIKNVDSITNELSKFLVIDDSLKLYHANRRLDSFFLQKYSTKKLVVALMMERLTRTKSSGFEFDDKLKDDEALHFNSIEEFQAYRKKFKEDLKLNNPTIIKDSINNRKD